MVEIRNLSAGYGGQRVLNEVTLDFHPGEVLTILGPNGCGKSTLLRTVAGLLPPSGGQILIDGRDAAQQKQKEIAKKISYLAQNRSIPNISAERMVLHGRFPYLSYPRHYGKEDYRIVREALQAVDAEEIAGCSMENLSGGQRQRVYIAMTLAQCTDTVLLDEPTTFLDVRHQLELMKLAGNLAQAGKAVVTVLHDIALAMKLSDRIGIMEAGRLLIVGTPDEVWRNGAIDRVFGVALKRMDTPDGVQYYILNKKDAE